MLVTPLSSSSRTILGLLVLLGLLMHPTIQTCGKGCLSCHEDVNTGTISCQICDIFNSYVKAFDGSCEQKVIENCEVPSLDRFSTPCVQCLPNYVLDIVQGKCVSVGFDKTVPDCLRYSSISTCISCNPDHYISFGKCIKSEISIPDCTHYSSEGICSQCIVDKFLDLDINECRDFPKATNCLGYNNLRCDQCKPGYAQDLNFYLRFTPSTSNVQSLATNTANFVQFSQEKDENCFKMNVENCKIHESADACLECNPQYFVTEARQCEAYPQNRISNCLVYSNKTTCQRCEFLYKLNGNECERRTLKPSCEKYEATTDDCELCSGEMMVTGGNCLARSTLMDGCETYTSNADTCAVPKSTYVLLNNGKVAPKIDNCKIYDLTGSSTTTCTECESDYFLTNNTPAGVCVKYVHQPFCAERELYLNECKVCATGYYKVSGECKASTMDFCKNFNTTEDKCLDCIEGFKFETSTGECLVVELNNCAVPSSTDGECTTCVEGFYLETSTKVCKMRNLVGCSDETPNLNECTTCNTGAGYVKGADNKCYLKLIPNCKVWTNEVCTTCEDDYFINEFGTCSKQLKIIANCTANSEEVCTSCNDVDTLYLEPISRYCLTRTNTSNCSTFETGADNCLTCDANFYLKGGKCIAEVNDTNCQTPKAGTNKCSACKNGYYLDSVTELCRKNDLTNCTGNGESNSFGCTSCNSGFYLNSRTKFCEKIYIPYCDTYDSTSLLCTDCEDGTYLDNGRCFKKWGLGCMTPKAASDNSKARCDACYPGYSLVSNECKVNNIANCTEFNPTVNTCKTCDAGFYPSSDFLICLVQYKLNCLEYTVNTNNCSKCESLFKVDSNNCEPITKSNCLMSAGVADECTLCKPGFKLTSNDCAVAVNTDNIAVQNCKGKTGNTEDYCDVCEENFMLLNFYSLFTTLPPNCVSMDGTKPLLCNQCAEFYELDLTTGVCKKAAVVTGCSQLKVGATQTLATADTGSNTDCAKCVDYDLYYLDGNKCFPRKPTNNCGKYSETSNDCLICQAPLNIVKNGLGSLNCYKPTGTVTNTSIANCSVYTQADSGVLTCAVCVIGKTGATCTEDSKADFHLGFFPAAKTEEAVPFAGEAKFNKLTLCTSDLDSVEAKVCGSETVDDHIALIVVEDPGYLANTFNYVTNKKELGSVYFASIDTFDNSEATSAWYNNTKVANCKIAIKGDNNSSCYACKSGFINTANEDGDDGSLPRKAITQCSDVTSLGLSKTKTGVGYVGERSKNQTNLSGIAYLNVGGVVPYDTCTNSRIPVAYIFSYVGVSGIKDYLNSYVYSNKKSSMECVDEINPAYFVENCEIYAYLSSNKNDTPDVRTTTDQNFQCISCKPGYKGTTNLITFNLMTKSSCEPIENCDLSASENTIMNSCGKCLSGYAWEQKNNQFSVSQHRCVEASPNCKIYNTEKQTCELCDLNFALDRNSNCVDKSKVNCDTLGLQFPRFDGFNHSDTVNSIYLNGSFDSYYLSLAMNPSETHLNCAACKSGYHNMLDTGATVEKHCYYKTSKVVENCLTYLANTSGKKCAQCKDGYFANTDTGLCVEASSSGNMEHCYSTTDTLLAKGQCSECKEGATMNSTVKVCFENENCRKTDSSGNCISCNDGYFVNFTSKKCEEVPGTSVCSNLINLGKDTLTQSICLSCKDPNLIPLNSGSSDDNIFSHRCIPNHYNNVKIQNPIVFDYDASTQLSNYDTLNLSFAENETSHLFAVNKFTSPRQVCAALPESQLNCQEFDFVNNKCISCFETYYLDSKDICKKGSITFCLDYENEFSCMKCDSGHFLDPIVAAGFTDTFEYKARGCKPYTVTCQVFDENNDGCISCSPYYFLDNSSEPIVCLPYSDTVDNCALFHPTKDQCLVCSEGYFMDDTPVCSPITVSNCAVFSNNANVCVTCREGFYLDLMKLCKPHQIQNCLTYSPTDDSCLVCPNGYYLEEGKCFESNLLGCDVPKQNEKKCSLCASGYYMDVINSVCHPHSVMHCSVFKRLENKCLTCDESSYMDTSGICKQYAAATNCETYHPNKDECVTCLDGFYNDANICKQYTMMSCKTFNLSENKCTSCYESFYLRTSDFSCQPITAFNCAEYSVSENRCSLCFSSYYLDIGTGNCLFYSVQNCEQYHPYKDNCSTCLDGHYLTDTFMCLEYTASGCASFSINSDACISCNNGFYLDISNQKCLPYKAKNCQSYQLQADLCSSCLPGFYLLNGLCKLYTVSHCAKNESLTDRCIGCIEGYYFSAGKCLAYTVEHCKDFDANSNKCLNCLPNYFFEFGHCFEYTVKNCASFRSDRDLCDTCDNTSMRIYRNANTDHCEEVTEIENCKEYSTSEDKCLECVEDFFLENQVCMANPTGIPKCQVYIGSDECGMCENGSYLSNNNCLTPQVSILGCEMYSSEKCCEQCSSGYALTSDLQCEVAIETSCASLADAYNCATCGFNEILVKNDDDNFVCVNSGILYCESPVSSAEGVICNKCEQGYFLNDGSTQCLWPETLVTNCRDYNGHGLCSRCENGYLLSKDNTKCTTDIALVGSQCLVGHISDKPKCARCDGGYYFNDSGVCQKCSENIDGCSVCDINNLSRCLICAKNYYMTDQFICEEYPPEEVIPIGVSIIKFAMIGILSFFMMVN